MTISQLTRRLQAVEQAVEQLRARMAINDDSKGRWWKEQAGRFENDPVFDEIAALGRKYRESLRPKSTRAKRDPA